MGIASLHFFYALRDGYAPAAVKNPLRQKSNLLARFNLICPVHPFTPPRNF
jgi:hypothetical protein